MGLENAKKATVFIQAKQLTAFSSLPAEAFDVPILQLAKDVRDMCKHDMNVWGDIRLSIPVE